MIDHIKRFTTAFIIAATLVTGSALGSDKALRFHATEVYDGDTIKIVYKMLPPGLDEMSVRANGIDTPEMPASSYYTTGKLGRAKCHQEAQLAIQARSVLLELVNRNNGIFEVVNYQWDKFGGRILGDIWVGDVNIAAELINLGLAIPYHGEAKTHDWCAPIVQ